MSDVYEGFNGNPKGCPRNLAGCSPLAQIVSEGVQSFMCVGEHKGNAAWPQDTCRLCHFSPQGVDIRFDCDSRDLAHLGGVIAWAQAIIAPVRGPERGAPLCPGVPSQQVVNPHGYMLDEHNQPQCAVCKEVTNAHYRQVPNLQCWNCGCPMSPARGPTS